MEFTISVSVKDVDGPYMYKTNDFFKHEGKIYRGRINSDRGSISSLTLKSLTPAEAKWIRDRGLFKNIELAIE